MNNTLTIKGPSVPINFYLSSASIKISNWKDPVYIFLFQGQVEGVKNKGDWNLVLKKGKVTSVEHEGNVSLKSFSVESLFKKFKGSFDVQFNEGSFKVSRGEGDVSFISDKGKISVSRFEGSLKGETVSGNVAASIKPKSVDVFSKSGRLNFYFRKTGPRVSAYSEKGKVYAPKYFYKKYSGTSLKASGRLKGIPKKGEVHLKTDTGNISFY